MGPAFLRRQAAGRLAVNVRDTALVVCAVGLVTLVFQLHSRGGGSGMHDTSILARMGGGSAASAAPSCCRYVKPIPYLEDRDAIGRLLEEEEGMTRGIELGVQRGAYAETILGQWTKCKQYTLVDVWGQQENYDDIANVSNDEQEAILREAHSRLDKFGKRGTKVEFLRMLTSEAAPHIPDGSLDFVYVDARHDYCGVKEDMELYWPKLREGGILAGHDFVQPVSWEKMGQDWTLCGDGSRKPLAVLGAVNDFAAEHDLQVIVPPFDWEFKSFLIRKPVTQCGGGGRGASRGARAVEAALASDV